MTSRDDLIDVEITTTSSDEEDIDVGKKESKSKKKQRRHKSDESDDDDASDDDTRHEKKKNKKKKHKSKKHDDDEDSDYDDETHGERHKKKSRGRKKSKDGRRRHSKSRSFSRLPPSEDPFAQREGKTLLWRDINMTLVGKGGAEDKKLLTDVWGEVPIGQTTAIMGPSGAGKSSLLNILAGRAASRGSLLIESDVRLNNFAVDPTDINVRQHIAFVAQDDSLLPTTTPREAIYFSARLRLPKSTPEKNLIKLTNHMLEELGLSHCADTIVGGPLLKGISGGERKRTSTGVELVVRPAMVFLDEPTSGLDSFSAVQLCQVLKKVAKAGASVLFTIHQPASEIFNSFDRLILMNKGRVMYQGPVNEISEYFEERGRPVPPKYNPADWIMNVAQATPIPKLNKLGFFPEDERLLPEAFTDMVPGKDALGITENSSQSGGMRNSQKVDVKTQTLMLFTRELKNIQRDTSIMVGRLGFSTVLSLLIGVIFFGVGDEPSDVGINLTSHFGALVMVMMMCMFGTAQPALLAFPQERPVFLREYSTNHYSVLSYFLARLTVEVVVTAIQIMLTCLITFWMIGFQQNFFMFFLNAYCLAMASTALSVTLGCAVEDPKLGQEMLPILFVPQLLFAGFFVSPDLMPKALAWARYIFSLTYSIRIGLIEEFGDGCGSEDADKACADLLESLDADPDESWWYWLVIVLIFLVFRALALFILQRKATKFF